MDPKGCFSLILPREDLSLGLCFQDAVASDLGKASYHELINRTLAVSPFTLAQRDKLQHANLSHDASLPEAPCALPFAHFQDGGRVAAATPPRRGHAPPRPRASRLTPPPARGAAPRAPAAPPRASSTQVAGSAVGGAYFPPLCEVEAGDPHAPPARGQLLLGCRRHSRRSLRRVEAGRPAPRGSPCVGGRGRRAAEPPRRSRGAGRRAAAAPARRRDALWGGLAQPPARDRARLLR